MKSSTFFPFKFPQFGGFQLNERFGNKNQSFPIIQINQKKLSILSLAIYFMKCAMQLQLLKKKKKAISFRQSKKEIKQLKNNFKYNVK